MGHSLLISFDIYIIQVVFWMSVAFILGTSIFWPWWKTDLGWTIILETISIGVLLLPTTMEFEFGIRADIPTWQWVASLSFVFVVVILPWRAWAIWKRQRYGDPASTGTSEALTAEDQTAEPD